MIIEPIIGGDSGRSPHPPGRQRRFGLRVRSCLVLVLIVGGGLGWHLRGVRDQRVVVDAVQRAGGHIGYDWEYRDDQYDPSGQPWAPDWLVKRVGIDHFASVVAIGLNGPGITDANMARIGRLGRLQQLNLTAVHGTDVGLAPLAGIAGLRALYLTDMPITDAGLSHLSLDRLRWLSLQGTAITDASLPRLRRATVLEFLSLKGTQITDAGLANLGPWTGLTQLSLENTAITNAGLIHLKGLTRLDTLWLGGSKADAAGVRQLRVALPSLVVEGVP